MSHDPYNGITFQFYDSTIKRCVNSKILGASGLFQFYDSTIKRFSFLVYFNSRYDFNSTIVRLKGESGSNAIIDSTEFQFYDSTIKSIHKQERMAHYQNFNSTIVRLKELYLMIRI